MSISGLSEAGGSGTVTAGASGALIAANDERTGLLVSVDPAATGPVYLLLGSGTSSATNFHIALAKGTSWNGLVGNDLWAGAIQVFSATDTDKIGVVEA